MTRRILLVLVLIGLAGAAYFFLLAASQVDASLNATLTSSSYQASTKAVALHEQLTIADLHADTLLWNRDVLDRHTYGHVDVPRLIDGHVALQAFTIVTKVPRDIKLEQNDSASDSITLLALAQRWPARTWTSRLSRALHQAERLRESASRSNGLLVTIHTVDDLSRHVARRAAGARSTAVFLGIEGAHALDGNLDNVGQLFDAGVRMIAPTHLADNEFAGSAHGVARGGLTAAGRELIRRLESAHILVDLAHTSPRAFAEAITLVTRPVVVSHTGVLGTCNNPRNLSDEQLLAIARTGGIIGIGYWETATCGRDADAIARAIRHAVRVAGIDHVALGSDFDGAVTQPFDTTGLVRITDALLSAGFNEDEIRAVMGGNVVRLLEATLPR
jgi:membrane dipeptidase